MLISSPRHKDIDVDLWIELEAADAIHASSVDLDRKAKRSMDAIATFKPDYIGVSWGKDSVVTAYLASLASPDSPLVNLRCSNRNPDCDRVRDHYLNTFGANQKYYEILVDYGSLHRSLAGDALDKATDILWGEGFAKASLRFGKRYASGIRADESGSRLRRCLKWGETSRNTCAPLAFWNTASVFAYMYRTKLPVHPAYAMLGAGRWPRDRIRTAEIGDTHGRGGGRDEWETEYYGDVLRQTRSGYASRGQQSNDN